MKGSLLVVRIDKEGRWIGRAGRVGVSRVVVDIVDVVELLNKDFALELLLGETDRDASRAFESGNVIGAPPVRLWVLLT